MARGYYRARVKHRTAAVDTTLFRIVNTQGIREIDIVSLKRRGRRRAPGLYLGNQISQEAMKKSVRIVFEIFVLIARCVDNFLIYPAKNITQLSHAFY